MLLRTLMFTSRVLAGTGLAATLLLCTPSANAQHWDVRAALDNVQSPSVRLTVKRDGSDETVEVIQRAWLTRMVAVSEKIAPEYQIAIPQMFLVRESAPNAFVTIADGRSILVFNTALLRMVGDDDDLMAVVVGHELGHLKANHLAKARQRQGLLTLLGVLAGAVADYHEARRGIDTQGLGMQVGELGANLVDAKFNRDQERQADALGIQVMAATGFDPSAAPRFWQMMRSYPGGDGLFLASHPSNEERERRMTTLAARFRVPDRPSSTMLATTQEPSNTYPHSTYTSTTPTNDEMSAGVPDAYRIGWAATKAGRHNDAFIQYQIAADAGDERAMALLGDAYLFGRGTSYDLAKAEQSYRASADKGFAASIYMLGNLAAGERGHAIDNAEAIRLLSIAAARGLPRASARLSLMYLSGIGVEKDLPKARALAEAANSKGDLLGAAVLGAMLRDGIGGKADPERGFPLLLRASNSDIGYASLQLGIAYERGTGTPVDKDKAAQAYRQALKLGVPVARARLTSMGYGD